MAKKTNANGAYKCNNHTARPLKGNRKTLLLDVICEFNLKTFIQDGISNISKLELLAHPRILCRIRELAIFLQQMPLPLLRRRRRETLCKGNPSLALHTL